MLRLEMGLSRRGFLHRGLALGAFMLPQAVRPLSAAIPKAKILKPRAKSVIFLLLDGGVSQLETWDMKPDAPSQIRGQFDPIDTTNPDLQVCEYMPLLATVYHQAGVDPGLIIADRKNRPVHILPHSEPVFELIAS